MSEEMNKTTESQNLTEQNIDLDKTMAPRRERKNDGRFEIGDLIMNRYKVLAQLGQGGMGVVYKCFDETAGIEVALKALPPELSHNTLEMDDIKDNFQLIHNLHHPGIASSNTLEKNPENGNYYLIMECCEGEDLRRWLKRKRGEGSLTPAAVLAIIKQVADALDYAHGQRIIHRDIKPGNIMINNEGAIKVLDFGLAAQIHTSMTRVSMAYQGTSGTAPYMAPEQWRGKKQGAAADQYALAVMTYEMLSGDLPFESTDPAVLQQAVLTQEADPIEGISADIQNALKRAMSKEPNERFDSCSDFVAAMEGAKIGKAKKGASAKGSGAGSALKWIAVILVLALFAGGAYFLYSLNEQKNIRAAKAAKAREKEREEEEAKEKTTQKQVTDDNSAIGKESENEDKTAADAVTQKDAEKTEKTEDEQAQATKKTEEEEARRIALVEAARRIALVEAARKAQEEAVRKALEEEARRKALEEARRKAQEEARRKAQEEAEKAEEEARKKAPLIEKAAAQNLLLSHDTKTATRVKDRNLISCDIPDGITDIGAMLFADCKDLTDVTIPKSVIYIRKEAFRGCKNLTNVTISEGVVNIGDAAFSGCQSLASITIPESVKIIGGHAFSFSSIRSITIPKHVTSIGANAFYRCRNLKSITIPDGVTNIGKEAFFDCNNLSEITIPDSVISIGKSAFSGCNNLKKLTIPRDFTEEDVNMWGVSADCEITRR